MIVCLLRTHERTNLDPALDRYLQGLGAASANDLRTARHHGALAETDNQSNRYDGDGSKKEILH